MGGGEAALSTSAPESTLCVCALRRGRRRLLLLLLLLLDSGLSHAPSTRLALEASLCVVVW
jgi:hypothetical protein